MKSRNMIHAAVPLALALAFTGCDRQVADSLSEEQEGHAQEEDVVHLTPKQIAAAGIEIIRPSVGSSAVMTVPATIESDPQTTQAVSAAIGGRIVALNGNLGQSVWKGDILAVIESRDAAGLRADLEAARARSALARSSLEREERLFQLKVSPERDLLAARTAMVEADIALRLARQQLAAAGVAGDSLTRIGVVAPIGGQITAREVVLGQTVAPDAELFRVANLGQVVVNLMLSAADAAKVRVGIPVKVRAGERSTQARIAFVSPVLDNATRLVPAMALLGNEGGRWRPGEPVTVEIQSGEADGSVSIPEAALQTVEGRTVVFVRTKDGFRVLPVTVLARGGGRASVSGLSGSEAIANIGSFTLKAELGKGDAEHGGH